MKYFFIIPTLTIGGAESIFLNTCKELIKKGEAVEVILLSNKIEYDIPNNLIIHNFSGIIGYFRFLRLCYNYKAEGIFISYMERANFVNLITSIILRIKKTYLSVHTAPKYGFKTRSKVKRLFINALYKLARLSDVHIITVSNGVAAELIQIYGFSQITVIPNFLKLNKVENVIKKRELLNLKTKEVKLLFVGRLAHVKGCDILLEAINQCAERKDITLTIVGDGPMKASYEAFASENNLNDKVSFVGKIKNVDSYMLAADYLIVPSYAEGFGIVILEALMAGCQIIYSNCSFGPKELMLEYFQCIDSFQFHDPSDNREISVNELAAILLGVESNIFNLNVYNDVITVIVENFTPEVVVNKIQALVK